ncbi:MAG: hypothetical protein QXV69_10115 [Sulfolobaceae archaeon]
MRVRVNITEPLIIEGTLDLGRVALLIGPNLNGKSLLLRCIYHSAVGEKYVLTIGFDKVGECSVDEEFNHVVYIDPYAIAYFLYDKYKEFFEEEPREKDTRKFTILSSVREDVKGILKIAEIRALTRDDDLFQGMKELENVVQQISQELKDVGHEEESKYIYPLRISVTTHGLEWKDVFGGEGTSVTQLTPSFYPSLVVTTVMYSYALSKKKAKVLLLLDEPDAFAYPSFAYTVGRIIRHFTDISDYLYAVITSHSWDFYKGILHGKSSNVKIFTWTRDGNKVSIVPFSTEEWYIPGFSVSAVLR